MKTILVFAGLAYLIWGAALIAAPLPTALLAFPVAGAGLVCFAFADHLGREGHDVTH